MVECSDFEGEGGMRLEFEALKCRESVGHYQIPLFLVADSYIADWSPMMRAILGDLSAGCSAANIAARTHRSFAELICEAAKLAERPVVCLSGGCFQNRYLFEAAVTRLREEGFRALYHTQLPCNDGGLSLGQIAAVNSKTVLPL
jgi:hydrogenase maturation protein HypF